MTQRSRGRIRSAPRRVVTCLLATTLFLASCHHTPATAPSPPVALSPTAALVRNVDALLAEPELARGTWGIAVRSLDRGDTLYDHHGGSMLVPASTLKIVTLAVAAERLGWDFRYSTRLY